MKNFLLVAAIVFIGAATSTAQFEGFVRMVAVSHTDDDSSVVRSTVYFKGELLAAEIEPQDTGADPGAKFIIRGDRNIMWIVLQAEGKVVEIPIADSSRGAGKGGIAGRDTSGISYSLKQTGKTMTLAGYRCEEWVADERKGKTARIWATKELGNTYEGVVKWFDEMSLESATADERWEREIAGKGLFPMRIKRFENGVVTESEDVISVERKTVPASMFEVPEGFERQRVDLNFEKMFEKELQNMEADSIRGDEEPQDPPVDDSDGGGMGD